MLCRHCRRDIRLIGRKLCQTCYKCESIRSRYPVKVRIKVKREKFVRTGSGVSEHHRMPSYPTSAPPGSRLKAAVMQRRLERGEHPHHPRDARSWLIASTPELLSGH